jgi:hypothetical protein
VVFFDAALLRFDMANASRRRRRQASSHLSNSFFFSDALSRLFDHSRAAGRSQDNEIYALALAESKDDASNVP